jgi:hypothetical protein
VPSGIIARKTALAWENQARPLFPRNWSLASFPFATSSPASTAKQNPHPGRAGLHRQGGESGAGRAARRGQDRDWRRGLFAEKLWRMDIAASSSAHRTCFDQMYASLADRSSRQLLNRLSRLDVLLIDELGYLTLKPEQSNIFLKLMEERYHRHSTIITTNLSYDEWGNFLGNPAMVDALLSRVRHYCHTIRIDGPSLRDPQG